MTGFIGILDRVLRWALIALAVAMIATVSWQVISRYALRAPSSLTEEIAPFSADLARLARRGLYVSQPDACRHRCPGHAAKGQSEARRRDGFACGLYGLCGADTDLWRAEACRANTGT